VPLEVLSSKGLPKSFGALGCLRQFRKAQILDVIGKMGKELARKTGKTPETKFMIFLL
jgi:hypothetical protein